ncbi:hypothetical protein [Arthrobacter dokdonensis]|uniref:hypothetical protein n=1 Tax=Arthrobacter dokdonellae TaxID=2211210 RepID=UPI001013D119|nr:hypothetical protein [Arthrobacter dokdonellae]
MSAAEPSKPIDKRSPPIAAEATAETAVAVNSQRMARLRFNEPLGATSKKARGVATAKPIVAM